MTTLLALLCFAAFLLLLLGLISPRLVVRWGSAEKRTRKKVLLFYGLLCISSSILFSVLDEGTDTTGSTSPQVEQGTTTSPASHKNNQKSTGNQNVRYITEAQVAQLTEGMSYSDFVAMMGGEGELVFDRQGVKTYLFLRSDNPDIEVRVAFDNGKLLNFTNSDEFEE